jgi:ABC-type proline/glycine betaine transport system substrate-binding protein
MVASTAGSMADPMESMMAASSVAPSAVRWDTRMAALTVAKRAVSKAGCSVVSMASTTADRLDDPTAD